MKKNLAILIYSLASGGAERVVSILLNEFKYKYNITLVLMNDTMFYDIPKDTKIIFLEKSDPKENGIYKLLKLPLLGFQYKNICKENNIDVSLSFMNRPNYINTFSRLTGNNSRVLISERIVPSQEYKTAGIKDKISRNLIKHLYPKVDVIIPNAIGIKNDLLKNFLISPLLINVINNPINLTKLLISKGEFTDEISQSIYTFITIGRFENQKNHKLMIEAMKNINAKLYIIGDGELRQALESQINELNLKLKVILLGRQENPYKYLAKADCFIFSSNYEGFPNVLLEALACELPVISTDCQSGPREILSPTSDMEFQLKDTIELADFGILTPVNCKDNLLKAMDLMMNDSKLRRSYKDKALDRAKEYDKDKIIQQWFDIIKD
ncbi:glycosyltransferase [Sulfurimonas sp. SAG-AH-194-I05]|nr:glycosyltransferase [Sulfurimonas sp. SAG-AH-194-I05]MDF1875195.1 glycosyltransferase [Sulfurimonas sp. SAG-AH-194-I05]